jgi:hypothetical protein
MADIIELERRVKALEAAQNDTTQTLRWVVAKLGGISALQDEHTLRLERIETDIRNLRRDLPAMMAETMREVLRGEKGGAS